MNRYRVNTNCNNMSRNSRAGRMRAGVEETRYVLDSAGCRLYDAEKDKEKTDDIYTDLKTCIDKNKDSVDAMINKDTCACASDSKGAITKDIKYPGYVGLKACTDTQGTCYKAALDACVKSKSTTCKLKNMSSTDRGLFWSLVALAGVLLVVVIIMVAMRYHKGAKVGPKTNAESTVI